MIIKSYEAINFSNISILAFQLSSMLIFIVIVPARLIKIWRLKKEHSQGVVNEFEVSNDDLRNSVVRNSRSIVLVASILLVLSLLIGWIGA
jgi:hypothetical protein